VHEVAPFSQHGGERSRAAPDVEDSGAGRETEPRAERVKHPAEGHALRVEEHVVGRGHEVEQPGVRAGPHHSACFFSILAHVSFRLTDRLNTGLPGWLSGSTMK
jgi:hypothetical protein